MKKWTLFEANECGLVIVQEKYNKKSKVRWWGPIDPWIAGDIYLNANFEKFFQENAKPADSNIIFPTFPIRKVLWILRMKPLQKELWEDWP